jgi:hypothetical protein
MGKLKADRFRRRAYPYVGRAVTAGEAIFLARRAGSVRAETAVSTVRMQPRGRQRFGALYRGFRARLARGLRELGCSRRSKAQSWSANRWNPANVG